MSEPRFRFRDGALVFILNGTLTKDGTRDHGMLNFTSAQIEALFDSFFRWVKSESLQYSGTLGTRMEEDPDA